jgi:D-alanyl-lipoteichoic acid acyltransferase DltB (MBOAT superfamily)
MMLLRNSNKVAFLSMLVAVVTGAYMMLTVWGGVAWLYVTLGSLVLVIVLSVALSKPRMVAVGQALAKEKGPISPTLPILANHPGLWISIQTRVAIILGIVFLKIAKPDLGQSLLAIGVAIALGVASALPLIRPAPVPEGSTS